MPRQTGWSARGNKYLASSRPRGDSCQLATGPKGTKGSPLPSRPRVEDVERNTCRTLRGWDAMLRGVSTQWMLAAQIDDGTPARTIEMVRNLPAAELASLDEAESLLASLTTRSPYQAAVAAHTAALEAFENLRADTTESKASKQDRASRALQLAVTAITSAPAESLQMASEILGAGDELAGIVSAVERLQESAEWQMLSEALVDGVPHLAWTEAVGGPEALLAARDGSSVRIQPQLDPVMQGLAFIAAEVFVATANKIQTASRVVRGLESEVLFGRASLVAFPAQGPGAQAGPMQVRELRVDLLAAAQGTLRRARSLLTAVAGSQGAEGNDSNPVIGTAASAKESAAAAETPEPAIEATGGRDEAERAARVARPPVDLSGVAQHLAETLSAVEEAYGQVPTIAEMFAAVRHDSGAYESLLRQIGIAARQTEETPIAAGIRPVRADSLSAADDITTLTVDNPSPEVRLRQQLAAELLVAEEAVRQLRSLQNPSELRIGLGGVIASVRFDPAAPSRVRGWMLLAARMAEHSAWAAGAATGAGDRGDDSAEVSWLARAAATCIDNGFHEAGLLYLAALAASLPGGETEESSESARQELAGETLRRFAAGDTRNASAVAIALAHAMRLPITIAAQATGDPAAPAASEPAAGSGDADSGTSGQ